MCSDPAHDNLTLKLWSDEERGCVGDGPPGDREIRDDREDIREENERQGQEVKERLLSFSGAPAPEILRPTMYMYYVYSCCSCTNHAHT